MSDLPSIKAQFRKASGISMLGGFLTAMTLCAFPATIMRPNSAIEYGLTTVAELAFAAGAIYTVRKGQKLYADADKALDQYFSSPKP